VGGDQRFPLRTYRSDDLPGVCDRNFQVTHYQISDQRYDGRDGMWHFDPNNMAIVLSDAGYTLRDRGVQGEPGLEGFEYLQDGYELRLLVRRFDDNDPAAPKMNFVFALGPALQLQRKQALLRQRAPIPRDKINDMAENIRDAMCVFVTVPRFKHDPPLGRVLFAMNDCPDWSATERPYP